MKYELIETYANVSHEELSAVDSRCEAVKIGNVTFAIFCGRGVDPYSTLPSEDRNYFFRYFFLTEDGKKLDPLVNREELPFARNSREMLGLVVASYLDNYDKWAAREDFYRHGMHDWQGWLVAFNRTSLERLKAKYYVPPVYND